MTWTSRESSAINRWIERNRDKVEHYFVEDDGYAPETGDWSHWIYLTKYCAGEDGLHIVHEPTVKDALAALARVRPCACWDCRP